MTIIDTQEFLVRSLHKYLSEKVYTRGLSTGTLTSFFPTLKIRSGFPDDLINVIPPLVAVSFENHLELDHQFFGGAFDSYNFAIHGFSGNAGSHGANKKQRDRLMNALYFLLSDVRFDLVNDSGLVLGDVETDNVIGTYVTSTSQDVEAMRYRFRIDLNAAVQLDLSQEEIT